MNIEDELRGALDVPAPPPTTRLEDVLTRGRRKVLGRRAGIAGSVLVVVAAVGIGAVAWPSGPSRVAGAVNWAQATPVPGQVADPPRPDRACEGGVAKPSLLATYGDVLSAQQMRTWWNLAEAVVPGKSVDAKHPELAMAESTRIYLVDVVDGQNSGFLRFSTERFHGSPAEAAGKALWATGGCAPPRRTTREDGTVFQLYDPGSITQTLFVFRADGRTFRLDQVSINGGLPLTEEELVELGTAIAGAP
jgi:hypothetical protein